jgi:viroplasmin and RNaseH domain-containing protein
MLYYVVHSGSKPGIYYTWDECLHYIKGYPNAIYKKVKTREDAEYFLKYGCMPSLNQEYIKEYGSISIFTDGSTIRKNNIVKYGYGVYIPELNIEISEEYIDENPTNNRCELTAILVGINIIVRDYKDIKMIHIYTDSQYAIIMLMKENYNENTINGDILEKIRSLINENNINIEYHKVEAHSGYNDNISTSNSVVDRLAYNGANMIKRYEGNIEDYKLSFGRYAGYALRNIPNTYLGWLVKQRRQTWVNNSIINDINNVIEYFKVCSNQK